LKCNLGLSDYCSIKINGDLFVIENDGGVLNVNGTQFNGYGECYLITVNSNDYVVCMFDINQFFIRIYREGDCSVAPHIIKTDEYDLLLLDGGRILLLSETDSLADKMILTTDDFIVYLDGSYILMLGD
jgi:hypothetical protein